MNILQIAFSAAGIVIAASSPVQAQSRAEGKSPAAAAQSKDEVGISAHDGITMSGADVIVTRNGISERLTKQLELENGMRIQPDGTIVTRDGSKVSLRPLQVLTFDGHFLNIPVHERVSTSSASRTEVSITPAAEAKAIDAEQPTSKQAAEEIARREADRRARAANEGEKAGAGSQK